MGPHVYFYKGNDDPQSSYSAKTHFTLLQVLAAHTFDVHLPNFLMSVGSSLEIPLATLLGRRYQLTNNEIAQLVALIALSRAIVDIPCGVLVEYVGLRYVMIASVLLNITAAVVGYYSTSPFSLVIFSILSGASLGCFFLSRHVFVARVVAKRYRGTYMSTISGVMRWAHVLGPTLGGVIIAYSGDVRNSLIVSMITGVLSTMSLLFSFWPHHDEGNVTIFSPTSARLRQSRLRQLDQDDAGTPASAPEQFPLIGSEKGETKKDVLSFLESPRESSWQCVANPSCNNAFCVSGMLQTFRQHACIIISLGIYVIMFTALRANRKLMMTFAGMQAELSDAHLTFLISFGFSIDAFLFPLGGLVMDYFGRQWAMVPSVVGFAVVFGLLPMAHTKNLLFAASGLFGVADSLGCGLIMTLVADRAPPRSSAPFFGIMRTLEDMGHVLGASGVGHALKVLGFSWTCYLLTFSGVFTALWGVLFIPRDHREGIDEDDDAHYHTPVDASEVLETPPQDWSHNKAGSVKVMESGNTSTLFGLHEGGVSNMTVTNDTKEEQDAHSACTLTVRIEKNQGSIADPRSKDYGAVL